MLKLLLIIRRLLLLGEAEEVQVARGKSPANLALTDVLHSNFQVSVELSNKECLHLIYD